MHRGPQEKGGSALVAVAGEVVVLAMAHAQLADDGAVVAAGVALLDKRPVRAVRQLERVLVLPLLLRELEVQALARLLLARLVAGRGGRRCLALAGG